MRVHVLLVLAMAAAAAADCPTGYTRGKNEDDYCYRLTDRKTHVSI